MQAVEAPLVVKRSAAKGSAPTARPCRRRPGPDQTHESEGRPASHDGSFGEKPRESRACAMYRESCFENDNAAGAHSSHVS